MSDLSVTTIDPATGYVSFRLRRGRSLKVTGREQLAQQFILNLLKTPGAEGEAQQLGGGLRRMLGQSANRDSARGAAMAACSASERQISSAQGSNRTVRTQEETLSTASVTDVTMATVAGALIRANVSVAITSAAGKPQVLTVGPSSIAL